jgi:hypothetical protein
MFIKNLEVKEQALDMLIWLFETCPPAKREMLFYMKNNQDFKDLYNFLQEKEAKGE